MRMFHRHVFGTILSRKVVDFVMPHLNFCVSPIELWIKMLKMMGKSIKKQRSKDKILTKAYVPSGYGSQKSIENAKLLFSLRIHLFSCLSIMSMHNVCLSYRMIWLVLLP